MLVQGDSGTLLWKLLFVRFYRLIHGGERVGAAFEAVDGDDDGRLFERLVVLEEVFHFFERVRVDVLDVFDMVEADVFGRHADYFIVGFSAVGHEHDADGTHRDEDAGGYWVGGEHDDVERIAVIPERLRCETVVKGVGRGREIDAVELDEARIFVDLVLIV